MGDQPIEGAVTRKPGTTDMHAIRHIDGVEVEVRGGHYDGVQVTDATGHVVYHMQEGTIDPDTNICHNDIISTALGQGKRGVPSNPIGVAMDEAVKRAFADSNLSETEARQFLNASQLISNSLKDGDFDAADTAGVLFAFNSIANPRGGRD